MLPSRPVRAAPVIVFVLAASQAAPVRGQPLSVRLELTAGPDCTTREELMARVQARSDRIQFADDAPTVIRASVAPVPGSRTVNGALTVEQPDVPATERRIRAPSCEQAADALALVIVLALDPAAMTSPAPPKSPPAPPPPPRPPVVAVVAPSPVPPPLAARTGGAVEAAGWVVVGPSPRPMPGVSIGGLLARDRPGFWSPALALSLRRAWSSDLVEPGGIATFTLDSAILEACPARLARSAFEGRACATLEVGRLAAAGSDTYTPASRERAYAATGASLRLAVDLTRHLQLGGRLEAAAPWRRDAFEFSPTVFHRIAAVTVNAGVSLAVRFR